MSKELVVIEQKPAIPEEWSYEESVAKVKQAVYKWKNLTIELATELWIAREKLSQWGGDRKSVEYQLNKSLIDKSWGNYCQEVGSSQIVVNRWLARIFGEEKEYPKISEPIPLPEGQFAVIVIDPPWAYGGNYDPEGHRVASPYPEMSIEELMALQIPSAPDCILWLWVTNAFMHEAYHLLEAWQFEPKTILTWFKEQTGVGYWLRGQTEHCILATKGSPQITHEAQGTALLSKARDHSRKPNEFYKLVESLCPSTPETRLEMFARTRREGWTVWGNEVESVS